MPITVEINELNDYRIILGITCSQPEPGIINALSFELLQWKNLNPSTTETDYTRFQLSIDPKYVVL